MARASTKKTGTEVANYDAELAAAAKASVESESTAGTGGGRFFSMRAGVLQYDGAQLPGNQMVCIVLDSIFETLYYESDFDPDNMASPTAFALGRNQEELVWNEEYSDPAFAGKLCSESEVCEWGSAETGRGKAAKETRRLAIIPAGTYTSAGRGGGFDLHLFEDPEDFAKADIAYMKLPVMSVKGFAGYLKQIAEQFQKPLFAMFTRVYLTPDPKSQFRVNFELIEPVPAELIPTLLARHKQAAKEIDFPYTPFTDDDDKQKGGGTANSAKKLSRGGGAAKKTSARKR